MGEPAVFHYQSSHSVCTHCTSQTPLITRAIGRGNQAGAAAPGFSPSPGMEGGSPSSSAEGTTTPTASGPSVHADGLEVAPAPKVGLHPVAGSDHWVERSPVPPRPRQASAGQPLLLVPLGCSQVRLFPIVGGNPGPR